eukprot:CFRG6927T1
MADPGTAQYSVQHALRLLLNRINTLLISPPLPLVKAGSSSITPKKPTQDGSCQTDPVDSALVKTKDIQLAERLDAQRQSQIAEATAQANKYARFQTTNANEHIDNPTMSAPNPTNVVIIASIVLVLTLSVMAYGVHFSSITAVRLRDLREKEAASEALASKIRLNTDEPQQTDRLLSLQFESTRTVLYNSPYVRDQDVMKLWNHLVALKLEPPEDEKDGDDDDDDDDNNNDTIVDWMSESFSIHAVVYSCSCAAVVVSLWSDAVWRDDLSLKRPKGQQFAQAWTLVIGVYALGCWFIDVDDGWITGAMCYVFTACFSYLPVFRLVQLIRFRATNQYDLELLKRFLPPPLMTNENLMQTYRHDIQLHSGDDTDDTSSDSSSRTRSHLPRHHQWCVWDRPLPAIPTSKAIGECWQPSKRREFCAPYYGISQQIVMVFEYILVSLTHKEFALVLYESITVFIVSTLLYMSRPDIDALLLPLLGSLFGVVVCVGRLCERSLGEYYLPRPVWVWFALLYSAVCFILGTTSTAGRSDILTDGKELPSLEVGVACRIYLVAFMSVWVWAYGFAELVIMKANVDTLSFQRVIQNVSTWCRTKNGIIAIVIHQGLYVGLFVFAMTEGIVTLLPFAVLFMIIGVLVAPMSLAWCILLYLPLATLLLPSSLLLSEVPMGVVLATISSVMNGPILEQAKLLLDAHYTVTIGGMLSLGVAMNYMFTEFWIIYMQTFSRNIRTAMGFAHALAMYLLMVALHVVAENENHSLLYLMYSLSACAALILSCQAFYPLLLNVSGLQSVAKEIVPVQTLSGMAFTEMETKGLSKAGINILVKKRKKMKRAESLKDQGILISNYMSLGGWEWLLYMLGLRTIFLVNENVIIRQVASLCVIIPIVSITYRYYRTWLCLSMDVIALCFATVARENILMILCLVLVVFHVVSHMLIKASKMVLFPAMIALVMAGAGGLIKVLQNTIDTNDAINDLYEEQAIWHLFRYINEHFEQL